jgi:hypothetical protein
MTMKLKRFCPQKNPTQGDAIWQMGKSPSSFRQFQQHPYLLSICHAPRHKRQDFIMRKLQLFPSSFPHNTRMSCHHGPPFYFKINQYLPLIQGKFITLSLSRTFYCFELTLVEGGCRNDVYPKLTIYKKRHKP